MSEQWTPCPGELVEHLGKPYIVVEVHSYKYRDRHLVLIKPDGWNGDYVFIPHVELKRRGNG